MVAPMNSSFAYTNPYSQSSQNASSWQHQLRAFLQNNAGVPSLESIQRLYHQLQQQQQSTTLECSFIIAKKFTDCCIRLILDQQQESAGVIPPSPVLASFLYVMIKSMEQYEESLTYAIVVEEDYLLAPNASRCNLLHVYQNLFVKSSASTALSSVACVGLATAWRGLDRIERLTLLQPCIADATWWLDASTNELAIAAVELLLRNELDFEIPTTHPFPSVEEVHTSCVGILSSSIKHNVTEWLFGFSDEKLQLLCLLLRSQANRLQMNDRSMSLSLHSLQLAISCAGLLLLISWKHSVQDVEQWKVQWCKDMGQQIVRVAFPGANTTPRGPRWTYESPATIRLLQPWAQELLLICKLCGEETLWTETDQQWLPFWETTWSRVLETKLSAPTQSQKDLNLDSAFCLHLLQPRVSRRALIKLLARHYEADELASTCRNLFDVLLSLCNAVRKMSAGPPMAFLRCFLSEGADSLCPDEFIRALWENLDEERLVYSFVKLASSDLSSRDDAKQGAFCPSLLLRLDVLGVLVASPEHCKQVLVHLKVHHVEELICIMSPKEIRVDSAYSLEATQPGVDEEDTPPANNLSRVDDKSICFEQEQERKPRGLDYAIRIAAATVLARLAYVTASLGMNSCDPVWFDEDTHLMQVRVRSAVGDFLSKDPPFFEPSRCFASLDMSKRQLRLTVAYATYENENLLVSRLNSIEMLRHRQCDQLNEELQRCRDLLQQAKFREVAFEAERKGLRREMDLRRLVFDREMGRCQQRAADDANQLAKMQAAERARTEAKAKELSKRVEESEAVLNEAERQIQVHVQAEAETREALNAATSTIRELEAKLNDQRQLCADREAEAEQVAFDLESAVHSLSQAKEQQRLMNDHIVFKEEELRALRSSYTVLQENLERLFADMVSLTQLYQIKEKETVDAGSKSERFVQDLKEQLDKERRRNEELERKERETRHENERLLKKLANFKHKFEAGRKERQEESESRQRLGPISYMNQLHNSTYSGRSEREKTWDKSFSRKNNK